jgi:hypothetical protein
MVSHIYHHPFCHHVLPSVPSNTSLKREDNLLMCRNYLFYEVFGGTIYNI